MTLHVHRSNRLEVLAQLVAELPPVVGDPFAPELFIIPTRGLERWLGMHLAERRGVFAHARFVSLDDWLDEVVAATLGVPTKSVETWRPGHLVWHIAEVLRAADDLGPLETWLGSDRAPGDALDGRTLQLAQRLAEVFHGYTLYRADLLEGWSNGAEVEPHDAWQANLWRQLVVHVGAPWPGQRLQSFIRSLHEGATLPASVAARAVLFGHHTIAPLHLDALHAIAGQREVHLMRPASATAPDWDENATRHALRASLDRLGMDLDKLLYERGVPIHSHIVQPGTSSALHHLQTSILAGGYEPPRIALDPNDRSLRFHACHGALRQVEALRDELLRLFDEDPSLEPRDVCVMTADIETFAPLIDAVFRDGDQRLPQDDPRSAGFPALHTIHDQSLRRANPTAEAFLTILDLVGGRLPKSRIVDLLAMSPVLGKAGLDPDDIDRVRELLHTSGIRWGLDAAWREAFDQPATPANTWRFGFDRLLLGHALATDGVRGFAEVVPVDDVEGEDSEVIGRVIDWLEKLFATIQDLASPRTVPEWRDRLGRLVAELLVHDDGSAGSAQVVLDELQALSERAIAGGFAAEIDLAALRALLIEPFELRRPSISFLSGGMTFCAMLPMRTVPFRVIGLIGMDEGAFPRQSRGMGFDLVLRDPRLGDRSSRDDDRCTFLETLLAAREHLVVTWTGLRATDQKGMEPASPVAELREATARLFGEHARHEPMFVEHALQPFSAKNFTVNSADEKPREVRSYDLRQAEGARIAHGTRIPAPPQWPVDAAVRSGDDAHGVHAPLTIDALVASFEQPTAWFCRNRLQLSLGERDKNESDREPIMLDQLEEWGLRDNLLQWELDGIDVATRQRALTNAGRLPLGAPGRRKERQLEAQVARIAKKVRQLTDGTEPSRVAIDAHLGGRRLVGFVDHVYHGRRRVVSQAGKARIKHRIGLWIRHLALTASGPIGTGGFESTLVAHDSVSTFGRVPRGEARTLLAELMALHERARSAPLMVFPETSWAWLEALLDGEDATKAARAQWEPQSRDWQKGDVGEPHVALLFGDRAKPYLDPEFRELTTRILKPLSEYLEIQ